MRIVGSQVQLTSRREYAEAYSLQERLRIRTRASPEPERSEGRGDRLELSPEAKAALAESAPAQEKPEQQLSLEDQLRILILRKLLGVVVKLPPELPNVPEGVEVAAVQGAAEGAPAESGPDWGLAYERHERYSESERLSVSARGVIQTADGREIKFDVEVAMSRTFVAEHHLSVRAGNMKLVDPLVINFDGPVADLTDRRYRFDLNADGTIDEIPFVGPGSGLLALDRNGDGQIGDGTELFGPTSGNGFAELAAFDSDRNGWIDEADAIWAGLKLWVKDAAGGDHLLSLAEAGVGALLLGNVTAGFTYKDQANQTQGQQQRAGIYLKEDGTVGTVQQIDLAV